MKSTTIWYEPGDAHARQVQDDEMFVEAVICRLRQGAPSLLELIRQERADRRPSRGSGSQITESEAKRLYQEILNVIHATQDAEGTHREVADAPF